MRSRLSKEEHRFLARARVCRVASVDGRGATHVAPLCPAYDSTRRTAYVWTDGRTARNLRMHPRAAMACDDYFEDWDRLRGVVAHVRAKGVLSGPGLERARRLLRGKFRQYREQYRSEEIDSVIALRVERVRSWGLKCPAIPLTFGPGGAELSFYDGATKTSVPPMPMPPSVRISHTAQRASSR